MATISSSVYNLPSVHKTHKPQRPTNLSHPNFNFIQSNSPLKFCRLRAKLKGCKYVVPVVVSCLVDDDSDAVREPEGVSGSVELNNGATIDLKLPRRSLLVQYTCNACGVRSQKLINRLAYEKGMVFVQCTGCSQYHKLVDNLNLVVEYDFREEMNASTDADQV